LTKNKGLEMLIKWKELKSWGINIGTYFQVKNKKKILLIGSGICLEYLQRELEDIQIQHTQDESESGIDIVVVIDHSCYAEIEKSFSEKGCTEVIGLEELVDKVYNNRIVISGNK